MILNLSFTGNLFLPEHPLDVPIGGGGHMRFAMPGSRSWLEPLIQMRRVAALARSTGELAQAIGFEFLGLSSEEERAIGMGCAEWEEHRMREYPLSARCYLKGEGDFQHFSRHARLTAGGRDRLRVSLHAGTDVPVGTWLRVKVGDVWVRGQVVDAGASQRHSELVLRLGDEWGRDFLLHEARRQSLQ